MKVFLSTKYLTYWCAFLLVMKFLDSNRIRLVNAIYI
jgi:hypothetical protein